MESSNAFVANEAIKDDGFGPKEVTVFNLNHLVPPLPPPCELSGGSPSPSAQTSKGYGFVVEIQCADFPWMMDKKSRDGLCWHGFTRNGCHCKEHSAYVYEIYKNDVGDVLETKRFGIFIDANQFAYLLYLCLQWQRHDWPIPEVLFVALTAVLRHHGVKSVAIFKMPFSVSLFSFLHRLLIDHSIDILTCAGFYELKRLCMLPIKANLLLSNEQKRIIDEEFLKPRVLPSQATLVRLLRFRSLEHDEMMLPAKWIASLCTMYMQSIGSTAQLYAKWSCAFDQPITAQMLIQHMENLSDFEYKNERGKHHIVRKKDGMRAQIEYELRGGSHWVYIEFILEPTI